MKNSFLIMDSWAKTLMCAPKEQAGELIQLLCRYQATGDDTCDDPMVSAVFAGWKEQIDANNEAYEAKVEGARKAREKKSERIKDNQELIASDIKPHQEPVRTDINGDNDTDTVISPKGDIYIVEQVREIVDYLNAKTSKKFSPKTAETRKAITARLKEGYTVDDFKKVIDTKVMDWGDGDMERYLRPQTLFRPSNFEAYLNEQHKPRASNKNPFNNVPQNTYDFDELEKQLVSN